MSLNEHDPAVTGEVVNHNQEITLMAVTDKPTCECGCGGTPTPGCRFIRWHTPIKDYGYTPDPTSGCWLWNGPLRRGYGMWPRNQKAAHRMMFEKHVGPIPDGFEIHHVCRNRACVNPAHLQALSVADHFKAHRGEFCKAGLHLMSPDNVYVPPDGRNRRNCRACRTDCSRRSRAARAGATS